MSLTFPIRPKSISLMKTLSILSSVSFYLVLGAIPQSEGKDPANYMSGIYWVAGAPKGLRATAVDFANNYLPMANKTLKENKYLSGIYIEIPWSLIEPEDGKFDLGRVDKIVELARTHKKFYKLNLTPGQHTPLFVFQNGAQAINTSITNPDRPNYGQKVQIPVPWDKTYQKYFYRALSELSKRYKEDNRLIAVTMTIACYMGPEWHLPQSKEDMVQWKKYDPNYMEKIKETWCAAIDQFAELFPNQQLCLAASSDPLGGHKEGNEIIEYGATHFPKRFTIVTNQLHGRFENSGYFAFDRVVEYKDRIHHGFQNLAELRGSGVKQGSMEMTVYNFLVADSEFLEVLFGDGRDVKTTEKLYGILKQAKELGAVKYKEELIEEGKWSPRENPKQRSSRSEKK